MFGFWPSNHFLVWILTLAVLLMFLVGGSSAAIGGMKSVAITDTYGACS